MKLEHVFLRCVGTVKMAKSCKGLAEELVKCLSESMCVKVICKTCLNIHMEILILLNSF